MAERLGHLNSVLRSAVGKVSGSPRRWPGRKRTSRRNRRPLEAVAARLAAAQEAPAEEEPSPEHRDALAQAASAARSAEMEARLSLRSAEEQLTAIRNRASSWNGPRPPSAAPARRPPNGPAAAGSRPAAPPLCPRPWSR